MRCLLSRLVFGLGVALFATMRCTAEPSGFETELELACNPQLGSQRGIGALLEGVGRSAVFWNGVLPLVAEYTLARKMTDGPRKQQRFEALHAKYAPRLKQLALRLRGMFIKRYKDIIHIKTNRQTQLMLRLPQRATGKLPRHDHAAGLPRGARSAAV